MKALISLNKNVKEKNTSHCNRSRVVISIEERERANYQKQCEREWRAKRSKSLYHQINNTEDVNVIKLISSGREQCWKKKKEDLLAIKLNCLGHIWQDKCELEAANIAQIYFYLLEISQPQMWRRNGISNRLSIMTGSGLTTTRTKMPCCLWKPTKTLCYLFSKKKKFQTTADIETKSTLEQG